MKTKINITGKIRMAVEEFQNYSYYEFQKLLPGYINIERNLGYSFLDQIFIRKTGISIKDYFNQVKAEKASELFNHYGLSPIEVAYQLGFKTLESLKKIIRLRNRYIKSRVQYPGLQRKTIIVPEFTI